MFKEFVLKLVSTKESKSLSKTFRDMNISVDSPEQDNICFNIPVFASKKDQIDGKGLKLLTVSLKTCLSPICLIQ